MKKVRITESQLKGLVKKMIREEMENRSFVGYDPMDDEPPFGGTEGDWREKNPSINVKGLSIADAIKKIKSESKVRILRIEDYDEDSQYPYFTLKTYIDRHNGVSEGYTFYYKKSQNQPNLQNLSLRDAFKQSPYPNGIATTDARFEQFEFD